MSLQRYALDEELDVNPLSALKASGGGVQIPSVTIAGLEVHALNRRETAHVICLMALRARQTHEPPAFCTSVNGHVVAECLQNPGFEALISSATLVSCDSQPLYLYSQLRQQKLPERVATTDLIYDVAEEAEREGLSFYLLGSTEDINARAAAELQRLYPKLNIVGRQHGHFPAEQENAVVNHIRSKSPDVLWIGMGVPLQEEFAARHMESFSTVGVIKTCGGCFSWLAGELPRAPRAWRAIGIEWAWRLFHEPKRLLWRYLTTSPTAIWVTLVMGNRPFAQRRGRLRR